MSLPNNEKEKIKIYANEYITTVTVNRPNLRLLENDLYLESLVASISGYDDVSVSAAITELSANISYLSGVVDSLSARFDSTSAATFVEPPSAVSAIGNAFDVAVSGDYLYVYHPLSGDLNWGRAQLDFNW